MGVVFVQPPKKGWRYWFIILLVVKLWIEITAHSMRARRPFAAEIKATTGKFKALS